MLFHVRMDVDLPVDMPVEARAELLAAEKEYSQKLQLDGSWLHLWRIVGEYANVSIFEAGSNDELHELLSGLPLFQHMRLTVTPLATHPSSLAEI